ncbi:MAG TPA: peptidoglycan bridge formation glycyltransferase FemA/FemB family protein [Actinomycetes bacterium]|nr:peptidoglycan bridge formation glycyltransferase FemA/FemB family protein [Actinomycetes bacterium]
MNPSLVVRPITADEHLAVVTERSGSFLQTPAWGKVKRDWTPQSLGWFDGPKLVGAGLVLHRSLPRIRRTLAYLPEGPVIDWSEYDCTAITDPLLAHLRSSGSFSVKMGPPVEIHRWKAQTIKDAIAGGTARRLSDAPPDVTNHAAVELVSRLREAGWTRRETSAGFGDFQPRYVFQLPLSERSLDDVFSGFNQLWRRNVRKAQKSGVQVRVGAPSDLPAFHRIYVETAERDRFTPRPLSYFQHMFDVMLREDPDRIRLYLGEHEGRLLAATTAVTVGEHTWYSYGASTNEGRELRPSNAIQWKMIEDAHAAGARVYDMRGITDTLDPDDHLFGLIQFKLGTGGEGVELVGEWDYPLNKVLHRAFTYYMERR